MFLHGARSIFELDEIDCFEQCGRRVMDGRESVGNKAYLFYRSARWLALLSILISVISQS